MERLWYRAAEFAWWREAQWMGCRWMENSEFAPPLLREPQE
jgi:hypothetical protein